MLPSGTNNLKAKEGMALCQLRPVNVEAAGEFHDMVREKQSVVAMNRDQVMHDLQT